MKVCIFGASSGHIENKYKNEAKQLGAELVATGNEIIFGAGGTGLMGAVAEGAKSNGGRIHGIVPAFFEQEGFDTPFFRTDEITLAEDISTRKLYMIEQSDAFVILPGGIGTLDEFFEVLSLKLFQRHNKTVIVYDAFGYYDELLSFLSHICEDKFINVDIKELFTVAHSISEVITLLTVRPADPQLHRKKN